VVNQKRGIRSFKVPSQGVSHKGKTVLRSSHQAGAAAWETLQRRIRSEWTWRGGGPFGERYYFWEFLFPPVRGGEELIEWMHRLLRADHIVKKGGEVGKGEGTLIEIENSEVERT